MVRAAKGSSSISITTCLHGVLDGLNGLLGTQEVVHGNLLVLVLLVVLKEALDLLEPVGGAAA